jgi:hypothetical protein
MKIRTDIDFVINSFDLFLGTTEGKWLFAFVMMIDKSLGLHSKTLVIKENILRLIKEEEGLYQNEGLIKKHIVTIAFWSDNLPEIEFQDEYKLQGSDIILEPAIFGYFDSEEGVELLAMVESVFEEKHKDFSVSEIIRWSKVIIDINLRDRAQAGLSIADLDSALESRKFWEDALAESWMKKLS